MGADAFRQKFRPKQRESDATKNLKNSGNSTLNKLNLLYESLYESLDFYFLLLFKQSFPLDKSIFSILAIQFLLVNDFFPWKVNFFLERKFLWVKQIIHVKVFSSYKRIISVWDFFLYKKFHPVQEIYSKNKCLSTWKTTWCDIEFPQSSWNKKIPTLARNFFLWQEFFSCNKKFLPVTRNLFFLQKIFLWLQISYCGKNFLPVEKYFLLRKIYVCDNARISANISCEPEDFVGAWLPGSRGISHPGVVILYDLKHSEQS